MRAPMRTATVENVLRNIGKIMKALETGEEVIITRRGKPVARLTAMGPKTEIDWPDFYSEAIAVRGKPMSEILLEERADRF